MTYLARLGIIGTILMSATSSMADAVGLDLRNHVQWYDWFYWGADAPSFINHYPINPPPDSIAGDARLSWLAEHPRQGLATPNFFFAEAPVGSNEGVQEATTALQCLKSRRWQTSQWSALLTQFMAVDVTIVIEPGICGGDIGCVDVAENHWDRYEKIRDIHMSESGPIVIGIEPGPIFSRVADRNGGVTAEQIMAETLIHEMAHIFLWPGDDHETPQGEQFGPEDPRFQTEGAEIYAFIRATYIEMFGYRPPLISVGEGNPTTSSEIPECLAGN